MRLNNHTLILFPEGAVIDQKFDFEIYDITSGDSHLVFLQSIRAVLHDKETRGLIVDTKTLALIRDIYDHLDHRVLVVSGIISSIPNTDWSQLSDMMQGISYDEILNQKYLSDNAKSVEGQRIIYTPSDFTEEDDDDD